MIWARKVDANQAEIVDRLRALHCEVHDMSRMGQGWPDLLINLCGETYVAEVKTARGKFTPAQIEFHAEWSGRPIVLLRTVRDAECFVIRVRNEVFNGRDD